jgi:hypothetical protein
MKILKLKLQKSRTLGYLDQRNQTKFKKIQFQAEGEIMDGEDPRAAYKELSDYIDAMILSEGK